MAREFEVDGAEAEKACKAKLFVILVGLARRFMLEEHNDQDRTSIL